jgi:hypothetical protein
VLANEERVVQAIRGTVTEPGLYFIPGIDRSRKPTEAEEKAWAERFRRGPSGILVVDPAGREPMVPQQFVVELLADILAAGVAAFILTLVTGSFATRVAVVGLLGVFEWLDVNVSYWNWDTYPTLFTLASLADQLIGWTLAGLVMALILRGREPAGSR